MLSRGQRHFQNLLFRTELLFLKPIYSGILITETLMFNRRRFCNAEVRFQFSSDQEEAVFRNERFFDVFYYIIIYYYNIQTYIYNFFLLNQAGQQPLFKNTTRHSIQSSRRNTLCVPLCHHVARNQSRNVSVVKIDYEVYLKPPK